MTYAVDAAASLAYSLVGSQQPRWRHVQAVGRCAEQLHNERGLPEAVVVAAWLHDIGYCPRISQTGFHPLDGAQFLLGNNFPLDVVQLVAWHTGAEFEAAERGLSKALNFFEEPPREYLDLLTMLDLSVSPMGDPVLDVARLTEILNRYKAGHPVHEAVTRSSPFLLAASRRAKQALTLPQNWPICR